MRSGSFQRFCSFGLFPTSEPSPNFTIMNGLCFVKQFFLQCFHKNLNFMHMQLLGRKYMEFKAWKKVLNLLSSKVANGWKNKCNFIFAFSNTSEMQSDASFHVLLISSLFSESNVENIVIFPTCCLWNRCPPSFFHIMVCLCMWLATWYGNQNNIPSLHAWGLSRVG